MQHQDLKNRTKLFALSIIQMFSFLPKNPVAQVLGRQVLRSGTSIGANFCEAARSRSDAEFLAKIGDCLKETEETHYWLELITESNLLPNEKTSVLLDESNQLNAIFTTIIKKLRSRP